MVLCLSGLGEVFNLKPDGQRFVLEGWKVVTTGPSQEWQQPDGAKFSTAIRVLSGRSARGAPQKTGCTTEGNVKTASSNPKSGVGEVFSRSSRARVSRVKRGGKLDRSRDGGGTTTYDGDTPPTAICQSQASDKQQPRSSKGVGGPESSKVRQFQ